MKTTNIFTRRHFQWLAEFARSNLSIHDTKVLSHCLERDNKNFDVACFEKSSGITEYDAGLALLKRSSTA